MVIQFDDFDDFTEEEKNKKEMSVLMTHKFKRMVNNMANEKFTLKIWYLGDKLKHGKYLSDRAGHAPECLDGKYDHRADVWSFGQVAYRLMIR